MFAVSNPAMEEDDPGQSTSETSGSQYNTYAWNPKQRESIVAPSTHLSSRGEIGAERLPASKRSPLVTTQGRWGDLGQGSAVSVGPIWYACIAIRPAKHRMPGEDNRKNCDNSSNEVVLIWQKGHQTPSGAKMAERTSNARWCQYGTRDIKCQAVPVIDVVSVVMASAILAPPYLWGLMCHIGTTWLGAILAPPGLWVLWLRVLPGQVSFCTTWSGVQSLQQKARLSSFPPIFLLKSEVTQ